MKRTICLALVGIVILLAACSATRGSQYAPPVYHSYKDIPGITQEDAQKIKALLQTKHTLVYGFPLSTEAFYRADGSLGGFVPLLFARMGELFEFEFVPHVCDWDKLVQGIESQQIDFTAEFTPTPERQQKYFITDPIIQQIGRASCRERV